MQFKNLKKALLLSKVLRKYNKRLTVKITQKEINILLCIHYMLVHGFPTSKGNIQKYYNKLGYSTSWTAFPICIDNLVIKNMLEKKLNKPHYQLTFNAKVELRDIDTLLRKERTDK